MNILHVVPAYKPAYVYGGPIESVSRLCETLGLLGVNIHVYTTTANGKCELDVELGNPVFVDNVPVTYFKRLTKDPTNISYSLWYNLFKNCKDYDLVHIHSWWNILVVISAVICHIRGVRVVISPRGMLSQYIIHNSHPFIKKIIHNVIGKWALKRSVLHATADTEFIECQKVIPKWNGFVLPNILQLPIKQPKRSNNEIFTIIFLSRIHPKKGLEILFEAISLIDSSLVLKIAGSGNDEYINSLKKLATDLNIVDKIIWLGWQNRDDKFSELAQSDLFILPSFNENFANTVIESLSVGTPVLITPHVGLASYVSDNKLGWVSELKPLPLLRSLQSAISDIEKRSFVNSFGRKIIFETFSSNSLAESYVKNYRSVSFEYSSNPLVEI